ncbi:WxL domain-containing protein [Bacillus sp. AFS041924]|uniref:WxL domain-containing protein n=1 Tax=Bacillus sp. AFS041924 TaxID=2033503 RepID=UPI000BFE8AC1|nr:WxL domain-containing protein [Bacillus sp. AFS041924]PGS48315.1 sporozoite surface protein 2 [Bacillus sp. AFS041924]
MKVSKIVAVGVLSIASFVGAANSALAAVTSQADSKVGVNFTPGSGPVTPVDPTDPQNPLEPTGPTDPTDPPTGETGPLTLDYVSSVQFGSQEISSTDQIYASISKKPFIQVSDRRGTGGGWKVTAKASKFNNGESESLLGAVVTFKNGSVVTPGGGTNPTPIQTITLNTDGTTESAVVTAENGSGLGTWITRWLGPTPDVDDGELNNNVTLKIPGGSATVGNHEATITWTLVDAPGA